MAAPVMQALVLALAWAALPSAAQALADPTQPPSANSTAPAAALAAPSESGPSESRLQMIIRGPGERRMALIGGRTVRVGDSVELDGQLARVQAIFDDRVIVLHGTQRTTLDLLPSVTAAPRNPFSAPSKAPGVKP